MKKALLLLAVSLWAALAADAQVIIINDSMLRSRMAEISAEVVDSLSNEPVSFASVYVIPSKDTTITNFTLSDAEGKAKLDEVPFGSYVLHVEMLGYKPFIKERYFREARVDMGTIRLRPDDRFLEAAVVSDVGNPIVIKKDTVEFNASSFRVGANAMLKDLLARMPGMEVKDDGTVTFNGEAIDKLTVGGRTFFFGDQSTALNNLPASVVDKIRVIDRESESTRASGLQDGTREKVLDVGLKKEYEQGWFGNASVKGGSTLGEKSDEELRDDRGLLYSGNALVSAYSEKDQLTFIANGQNINDSNGVVFVMIGEDGERSSMDPGITSAAQLGLNLNTSRLKDVETTLGANYKYTDTDTGTRSRRTTFQDDGDLLGTSESAGKQYANSVAVNLEMEKETGKVWFHFRPSFRHESTESFNTMASATERGGLLINSSESDTHSSDRTSSVSFASDVSFREIGGKKSRILRIALNGNADSNTGSSDENTLLRTAISQSTRSLSYATDGSSNGWSGSLSYTEPISDKWSVSPTASLQYTRTSQVRDAFDASGRNDYYSSESRSDFIAQVYGLTAQYKFQPSSWITLGASLRGLLNETFSRSYGVEDTTGKDDWNWFVIPTVRFQHSIGANRFNFSVYGYSRKPSASNMLPVLNISNPSRLSLGNIYLKPYASTSFSASWTKSNPKRFSSLVATLFGQVNTRPMSQAMWYDSDGILYSIPVNGRRPYTNAFLSVYYTTPLDGKKLWSMTASGGASAARSTSYQTRTALPGPDKDNFDYTSFMDGFWGDSDGDRFYSGASGFSRSSTTSLSPHAGLSLKYNQTHYYITASANISGHIARYSLNPDADLNTMNTSLSLHGSYTTKHEFEFNSDITYESYSGYAPGYGKPEWQWNASVSKNIGAFNLSLTVKDILDQTRSLRHSVTANYVEDSYRLIMGRYFLFGVRWNFGKMNAAHSQRAEQAAWDMAW